ncbi:MAG TPA: 4-hydroxy-3-methylbut-2-enyl diphosphate reductase [Candidatus Omnitrophota bacterium]|nr:4-hydroxy-3-methylbut-2-enyl diphosphate reductase [Candidatus Omnitrophota bacterium]
MSMPDKTSSAGLGLKGVVKSQLDQSYHSPLIEKIRASGFFLRSGRLEIHLAKEFGFCYGVERAVEYAYETRARFPTRRIFLTNEIIHNPRVNAELQSMGIRILADSASASEITGKDVVIMPAFGVPVEALKQFRERGCVIVDTTCGSVMSVWRRVESYNRDGFTAVIHGKYDHEETRATCSRAEKYLVVKDKEQAAVVCDFISEKTSRETILGRFQNACSGGFDPEKDLQKIGFANQTTMLSRESIEISDMLRSALQERYGAGALADRFRHFDTICSATQDRQDAIRELGEKKMDLILVIGGYKSSNTGHLAEIASGFCPAYHVEDASCLLSREKIRHKKIGTQEILETEKWLPAGEIKIGITAGASTPNRLVEEVIQRILDISK